MRETDKALPLLLDELDFQSAGRSHGSTRGIHPDVDTCHLRGFGPETSWQPKAFRGHLGGGGLLGMVLLGWKEGSVPTGTGRSPYRAERKDRCFTTMWAHVGHQWWDAETGARRTL